MKKEKIIGYKIFNPDWTCRNYDFKTNKGSAIGSIHKLDSKSPLVLCSNGFHFCRKPNMCFNYYSFDSQNKVAQIEILGNFIGDPEDKECCDNFKIIRELSWNEVLTIINTGKANSGHSNSGHRNSGNSNSGHSNSGHRNSGDSNSGHRNSGDSSSGHSNSGHRNSGDNNSGHSNSGDGNSGDGNSGHRNSGHRNSGHRNSGDGNSGHSNSGDGNSGGWNSCDREPGYFNSIVSDTINVFNKQCKKDIWENSLKPNFIYNFELNKWISFSKMSNDEKIQFPKAYVCDGYLKALTYKEAWGNAYKNASKEDIQLLKNLPNFDAKVFEEISGIKIK
jgi:hypothetical protein